MDPLSLSGLEPWIARLLATSDAQERDRLLLDATVDCCGPAALWREDAGGAWHAIAGETPGGIGATQVAALVTGDTLTSLPLVQVLAAGDPRGRIALVLDSAAEADLATSLLVLATICAEHGQAPTALVDLFQGPLPRDRDAPDGRDRPTETGREPAPARLPKDPGPGSPGG